VTQTLEDIMTIDGALAAAVVDANSGMVLGKIGTGVDLDIAGAGNTEVVRAKLKTMKALGLKDTIEDMLITLGKQYHIIRPLRRTPAVFYYLACERSRTNLAMARRSLAEIEQATTL
jgi:predicted regulator of Ras-like GTPase activity (Roadblock/LC7/MglB family)